MLQVTIFGNEKDFRFSQIFPILHKNKCSTNILMKEETRKQLMEEAEIVAFKNAALAGAVQRMENDWNKKYIHKPTPKRWIAKRNMAGKGQAEKWHFYVPIEATQEILTYLFGSYKTKVVSTQLMVNAVIASVEVTVIHPASGREWKVAGSGAGIIQVRGGANALEISSINPVAMELASGKALSYAVHNAAKRYGRIFGGYLGRNEDQQSAVYDTFIDAESKRVIAEINEFRQLASVEASHVEAINDGKWYVSEKWYLDALTDKMNQLNQLEAPKAQHINNGGQNGNTLF